MFNKNKLKKKLDEMLKDKIDLSQNKEMSHLTAILESYHAHFEKMLEVQAKILNVLEQHTHIRGFFDDEYYYKQKGFEKADTKRIIDGTINPDN